MRLSIIIPVHNEAQNIQTLVEALGEVYPQAQIVVVDDGSIDNSGQMAAAAGARVVSHPYNIGNGAAVKSGIRAADGDVLVFMDGDGQHDPKDIGKLLSLVERYDMVVGARSAAQQASWGRGVMNRIFNRLARYVTGFAVEDLTSGFRAVRAEVVRDMVPLLPNSYSWPTTMTLVLLRSGFSLKYVPINVQPRAHGRSGIRPIRDGARFFMILLKICTLYSPFRIFLPVSVGMGLLGLLNYAYTYFTAGRFTNMSTLMFTAAVIVFMMGLISEQISQIGLLRQQVRHARVGGESDKSVSQQSPASIDNS